MATRGPTTVKASGRGRGKKVAGKKTVKRAKTVAAKKSTKKTATAKASKKTAKASKKAAGTLNRAEYRRKLDQGIERARKQLAGKNATQIRAAAKRAGVTTDSNNRPITTRTPVGDIRQAIINRQARRFANG